MTATPATGTAAPATVERSRLRHASLVIGMVLAPLTWLVANTAYLLATRDGGSDEDGAATLALAGEHPTLLRVAVVAVMVGGILVVPAVLGFFSLAPRSRAVTVGGSLMIAGYISYAGIAASGLTAIAMAERATPVADDAAVLDAAMTDPWGFWAFLVFAFGNLIGTLVLAIGLVRTRSLPKWPAVLIACWPVLHVIGLVFFSNEVPQVIGAALQAIGFVALGVVLHRELPHRGHRKHGASLNGPTAYRPAAPVRALRRV